MADLKEIIKELESIEDSLRDNDTDTASLDLHLLLVELLNEVKTNSAQLLIKSNRRAIRETEVYVIYNRYTQYSMFNMCGVLFNYVRIIYPSGFNVE